MWIIGGGGDKFGYDARTYVWFDVDGKTILREFYSSKW